MNSRMVSPKFRAIFAQFTTMQDKQILARAIGIQKENCELWVTTYFSEIIKQPNF